MSMDFQIGSAITLTIMEGGSHIIMNDRFTLLLELDRVIYNYYIIYGPESSGTVDFSKYAKTTC